MSLTENHFKHTNVAGNFKNTDYPDASNLAHGFFQRDVEIGGTIINTNLTNELASKATIVYVDGKIAELVDSSPATLDTLNELANALGDDPNFATTVSTNIGLKADKTYTDSQLALKSNTASPSFTGTTNIVNLNHTGTINSPAIQASINTSITSARTTLVSTNANSTVSAYLHVGNHALAYNNYHTQSFGSISANKFTAGEAEMNFIQNGLIPGATKRAFNFLIATSNTTFTELMKIYKNGDMVVTGDVTTPNLNVTTSIVSPTITTINTNIALKADKTYVDTQLLLKDDITSVNSKLALKDDITSVNSKLALKDDVTSVNSKLLLKSDLTYVDDEILNLQNQIDNIEGNYNPTSNVTFQNLTVSGTITNTALTNLINTKANLSLVSNVTNTSDMNKPVSTAQQSALDLKANIASPSFTGTTNIVNLNHTGTINSPAIQTLLNNYVLSTTFTNALNLKLSSNVNSATSAYLHFSGHSLPYTEYLTQNFGAISANRAGAGHAEMNFIQNGYIPGATYRAFNFMIATSNTTFTELMKINKNGDMVVTGNVTTPTLNATTSIVSPTITTINTAISTINSSISNVNNTSDMNKPVSTAQQTALDLKLNKTGDSLNAVNGTFTGLLTGPTISTINNNIGLKSDTTYVDAQLALKDDITSVNSKLALKDDITSVNTKLALKANINNTTLTGTTTIDNLYHTGTLYSPAIQSLLDSKANTNNPVFTGNMTVGTSLLGGITVNGGNATASGTGKGLINARNFMSSYYSINANTTFTWDMMPGYIYCRGSTGGYIQVTLPNPAASDKIYGFAVKIVAMNNYPIRVQSTNDIRISTGDVAFWTFQDMCKTKTFICADPTGGTMQWMLSEDK